MTLPKIIPESWHYSGPWLMAYRLLDEDQDIIPVLPLSRDILCPLCEYPEAVQFSTKQTRYQICFHCPECGSVWGMYCAVCLDCGGFVWNKECGDDEVKCSLCGTVWELDLIKSEHEDSDFTIGYYG